MRPQRDEPVRLDPVPALQHPHHRRLQVVVADPLRDAAVVLERPDVAIEEHLLALVQIRPCVAPTRRREPHDEHRHLHRATRQNHVGRPEVGLGLVAQRMVLRDHHLHQRHVHAPADLGHVAAYRRLAQLGIVLFGQALPHPPSGVPLLPRCQGVRRQPLVDRRLPPIQRRRRPHSPLAFGWHRRRQRLAHITTMHTEPAGQLVDRELLAVVSLADLLVQLHLRPLGHRPRSTAGHTHRWTPPRWGQIR